MYTLVLELKKYNPLPITAKETCVEFLFYDCNNSHTRFSLPWHGTENQHAKCSLVLFPEVRTCRQIQHFFLQSHLLHSVFHHRHNLHCCCYPLWSYISWNLTSRKFTVEMRKKKTANEKYYSRIAKRTKFWHKLYNNEAAKALYSRRCETTKHLIQFC